MTNYTSGIIPTNRLLFQDTATWSGRSDESAQVIEQLNEFFDHFYIPVSRMNLINRFLYLEKAWKEEVNFVSSTNEIVVNSNHLQIIGMGPYALPLILLSMQREPFHWFHALFAITGENPVPSELRGDIKAMTSIWIEWGRNRGIVA